MPTMRRGRWGWPWHVVSDMLDSEEDRASVLKVRRDVARKLRTRRKISRTKTRQWAKRREAKRG